MGWQITRVCYGFLVVWGLAVLIHGLYRQAVEPSEPAELPPPAAHEH